MQSGNHLSERSALRFDTVTLGLFAVNATEPIRH
jgi:hypothetical protein